MMNNLNEKSIKATFSLLCNLFSDSKYDENQKLLCEFTCRNGVENFINKEIFTNGLIRLGLPQNLNPDDKELFPDQKLFCHMAAAYLLHCRYNSKLERCEAAKYSLKAIDSFLLNDVLCSFASQNYSQWEQCNRTLLEAGKFFEQLQKTSIYFVSPSGICHTWSGVDYISGGENCLQIELLVKGRADRIYKTYKDYVKYLLSKERNSIHTFTSSHQLWEKATKINHKNETNYLENRSAEDKELLFCLALGLDKEVLARLNKLRRRNANPMPHIGENEIYALKSYLEKIKEHFAVAKDTEKDPEKIPRRMLLNANIYLLTLGFSPIIPLFGDDEIDEFKTLVYSRGMPEKLNAAYFEKVDANGRRSWIFKTRELLIEESDRLLRNGQPPMIKLTSEEIDGLEEIARNNALRFYDRIYDKDKKQYRWIIKRGVQLTPNNNLNFNTKQI